MEAMNNVQERKTENTLASRVFEVVTNEEYLNEEQIKQGLQMRTIKQYAYILHDKDIYTNEDLSKYKKNHSEEPSWKIGDLKKKHWHVVFNTQRQTLVSNVAKWFNVPFQQVAIAKGRGAFLDKVQYLTHEKEKQQALGKKLYDDSEVIANFDFRKALIDREKDFQDYGQELSPADRMLCDVMYRGKTIRQCELDDKLLCQKLLPKLNKARLEYIRRFAPLPNARINYYVQGDGGQGKDELCIALARSFFPDAEDINDIVFVVGADNVTFEGYDGQPVIIWQDVRAYELLQRLKGRGNVFNIFDTFPKEAIGRQNVKNDSVRLIQVINIVNSNQPYLDFLDGLAGEFTTRTGEKIMAEDKSQSYRRFPLIIPLHEEDFDLLLNKGFLENTREFTQYVAYHNIRGNMAKIAAACGANRELKNELQQQAVQLPYQEGKKLLDRANHPLSEEEVSNIKKMGPINLTVSEG